MRLKRIIPAILIMLASALGTLAQHSVSLSFTASVTAGVTRYNLYRAVCTGTVTGGTCSAEGPFTNIGNTTTTNFVDSTVVAGGLYSYYVTAVCPTACNPTESVGSNHVAAVVPKDPPAPPTGLSITTVSRNSTGANTTLSASYTATPNVRTTYAFRSGSSVISSGAQVNATGTYAVSWSGKLKPGTPVVFQVCDANNSCDSRTI
jgi:hypothetical protein